MEIQILHKQELGIKEISKRTGHSRNTIRRYLRGDSTEQVRAAKELQDSAIVRTGRTAALRRLVTEAYGFRCAATGWRVILPDYSVLVEAAHIIPFSETQDDRPQNGMALTPNFHWAMDRNIIVPGPDLRWHVSKSLDERIADNEPLLAISGKEVLLPKDERFKPDVISLEWRLAQLQ